MFDMLEFCPWFCNAMNAMCFGCGLMVLSSPTFQKGYVQSVFWATWTSSW